MAEAIHPVMVGTSGHIDHGKSSLVQALTGVDPDRLKEEKERGLTIDLGFAPLQLEDGRTMGMVDVPGHEGLVRNMVAGSTALDLAILVVAADDGVMPQTVEHLDILDLLGVRRGVVALTKVDLVDEQLTELAEAEVRELLASTTLKDSNVVRVSAITGQGIDELRSELNRMASELEPRPHHGAFRMPVQRVFQLKGIGTVVTGIPVSGAIESGQAVEFQPGGHLSKVRALQAFGRSVSRAVAGHSTALSVPDARSAGLRRGMVAAAPGVFQVGDAVDIELRLTDRVRPVKHRCPVRFHSGTAEAQGLLLLLDRDRLGPGETAVARIALEEDVCVAPSDRFLIRLQNPVMTIGGGNVLRLGRSPRRYTRRDVGEELERLSAAGAKPETRVTEELTLAGVNGLTPEQLAAGLGLTADVIRELLTTLDGVHLHVRSGRAFTSETLQGGIDELFASVDRMLRNKPLAASIMRSAFRPSRELPAVLLDAAIDRLAEEGRVRTSAQGRILFSERLRALDPADQAGIDALVAHCVDVEFRPPTRIDLEEQLGQGAERIEGWLARAMDEGKVDAVGNHIYAASTIQRALVAIRSNCLANDLVLDIPKLRDELGTSRKCLFSLLEHVDQIGLTRLRSGVRVLLPSSAVAQELEQLGADGASPA